MKKLILAAAVTCALCLPLSAQEAEAPAPSPNEIVNSASAEEWVAIAPEDMLVMTLAPDGRGRKRTVVIQLMPAPFSQGWVENIRTLARAEWYDGISVNRVQDNYVVQWGDPGYDNPESGEAETKPLPEGLNVMGEEDYEVPVQQAFANPLFPVSETQRIAAVSGLLELSDMDMSEVSENQMAQLASNFRMVRSDSYALETYVVAGWPVAMFGSIENNPTAAPVHCYGMVGVGRNYSPDTGSGAELYTVIGHAPRHLDRNIALVGRIISGIEHLSSLPRGSGALGFYTEEEAQLRVPILSIRVASDLPEEEQPRFEYLTTEGETFARYAEARANRRDPFFIHPAGGADICNIPVPIRAVEDAG